MNRRRGSVLIETAMFIPLLLVLLVGTVEIAKVIYTYQMLHKMLYSVARFVSTQNGANPCDSDNDVVSLAKSYALSGVADSTESTVQGLTADMIQVRVERYDSSSSELGECQCAITGCDTAAGGRPPDFIVVSIPDGYPIRPAIPYVIPDVILLRPRVRVPYGGL